jgi:CP family cyanate transporter-like MFS transporter
VGYTGLMVAPYSLAPLWAVLVGIGTVTFPLILTLIGLRARTTDGTAALSGFTQSLGYLMAALGPFVVGTVYDGTGGWTAPLLLLLALVAPLMAAGAYVGRPAYLEDQLR